MSVNNNPIKQDPYSYCELALTKDENNNTRLTCKKVDLFSLHGILEGIWILLGKYVHSRKSYDLVKIGEYLRKQNLNENENATNVEIYNAKVDSYQNSVWRVIFEANPRIEKINTFALDAIANTDQVDSVNSSVTSSPSLPAPINQALTETTLNAPGASKRQPPPPLAHQY